MPDHPFGFWSIVPPLAAIVLAIVTRRVIVSLLAGAALGALILAGGNPIAAAAALLEGHLWPSLVDEDHLRVFAFTLLMGAMVGVIHRCGGMHGVVDRLAPLARSRRGGQLVTWALGLLIFFDDYANTLLLGGTMRSLTDRLRISREKLAYLVDSTAAPVAGLAVISTWVAGEIGYIESGLAGLEFAEENVDGLSMFVATIPYRFYVLLALVLVPLVAISGRDFGPMLTAERRAASAADPDGAAQISRRRTPRRWYDAAIPVATAIAVTVWLVVHTGLVATAGGPSARTWLDILAQADSYLALVYGGLAGLLAASALGWQSGALRGRKLGEAAFEGARLMLPALAILWLAWALAGMTGGEHLQTGAYLGEWIRRGIPPQGMPTIVFLVAAGVSFSTGTSWGTMGLLMPLAIDTTFRVLAAEGTAVSASDPILVASVGGVLAGAIFGDHCSPISDTTVLSSLASGCNHIAHVRTQLPYALLAALVAVACGTVPVGLGVGVWWLLPFGLATLIASVYVLGRRV